MTCGGSAFGLARHTSYMSVREATDGPHASSSAHGTGYAPVCGGRVEADTGLRDRFKAAYAIAERTVDSGAAMDLLDRWIEVANAAE
ncbi:hypothetical protein [Bifidobacterium sp. ESL0763]|uniref:hypothetical protein n=1 Tax=Bifidobacterium sp. ESL0763 TaxID=2983227 RepID=UPI0027E1E2BC|nr:hypothetical protein [Bifidobacterium sp. ESL0763]